MSREQEMMSTSPGSTGTKDPRGLPKSELSAWCLFSDSVVLILSCPPRHPGKHFILQAKKAVNQLLGGEHVKKSTPTFASEHPYCQLSPGGTANLTPAVFSKLDRKPLPSIGRQCQEGGVADEARDRPCPQASTAASGDASPSDLPSRSLRGRRPSQYVSIPLDAEETNPFGDPVEPMLGSGSSSGSGVGQDHRTDDGCLSTQTLHVRTQESVSISQARAHGRC